MTCPKNVGHVSNFHSFLREPEIIMKKKKKNTRQPESSVDDSLMSSSYVNIIKSTDNEYTIKHKYRYHKALLLHAVALLFSFGITFVFTNGYLQKFMETGSIFKIFVMGHGDPNYYVLGNLLFFVGVTMLLPMLNIHLILSFVLHSTRPLYTTIIIYDNIHINITKMILGVTYSQKNIVFAKDAPMFYSMVNTLSFLQCIDYRDLKKISSSDWGYGLFIHDKSCNLLLSIDDLSYDSMMKIRITLQSELNLKKKI